MLYDPLNVSFNVAPSLKSLNPTDKFLLPSYACNIHSDVIIPDIRDTVHTTLLGEEKLLLGWMLSPRDRVKLSPVDVASRVKYIHPEKNTIDPTLM